MSDKISVILLLYEFLSRIAILFPLSALVIMMCESFLKFLRICVSWFFDLEEHGVKSSIIHTRLCNKTKERWIVKLMFVVQRE